MKLRLLIIPAALAGVACEPLSRPGEENDPLLTMTATTTIDCALVEPPESLVMSDYDTLGTAPIEADVICDDMTMTSSSGLARARARVWAPAPLPIVWREWQAKVGTAIPMVTFEAYYKNGDIRSEAGAFVTAGGPITSINFKRDDASGWAIAFRKTMGPDAPMGQVYKLVLKNRGRSVRSIVNGKRGEKTTGLEYDIVVGPP
jgi:hypothetical protein